MSRQWDDPIPHLPPLPQKKIQLPAAIALQEEMFSLSQVVNLSVSFLETMLYDLFTKGLSACFYPPFIQFPTSSIFIQL